jgi:putative transposase
MKEKTAYKFRIYPDGRQAHLFRRTIGCCRLVFNACLRAKKDAWSGEEKVNLTSFDQIKSIPALKQQYPFLREVPNHCLQQAVVDLHKAYTNFFEKRASFPRFRNKYRNESFRFPDPKQLKFRPDAIFLPKAGWVRMVAHREVVGTIKNVTVSLSGDHWYASIQVERECDEPATVAPEDAVERACDLGVVNAMTMDDGEVFDLPRMTEKERKKQAALQQTVARRTKGSKNHGKAKRALRRFLASVARKRKDAKHKATTAIANSCDVLFLEDLKVRNMTASAAGTVEEPGVNVAQKAGLNRSILDVSPGETRVQVLYKMRRKGGSVYFVPAAYTSQRCSACGHVEAGNRPDRDTFRCLSCGHGDCADRNAAVNILYLGRKARTGGHPGLACGSNRVAGRKQETFGSSQSANAA